MFFTVFFAYIGWTENFVEAITFEKVAYMLMIFTGVYLISRSAYRERKRKAALKKLCHSRKNGIVKFISTPIARY
jgi:uncharacterized membrane protein YfcA